MAATLELSQPEVEQQKERVLAAASTELERLFKKEDFSRMKVVSMIHIVILLTCNNIASNFFFVVEGLALAFWGIWKCLFGLIL